MLGMILVVEMSIEEMVLSGRVDSSLGMPFGGRNCTTWSAKADDRRIIAGPLPSFLGAVACEAVREKEIKEFKSGADRAEYCPR